jgi:hypothetical protein
VAIMQTKAQIETMWKSAKHQEREQRGQSTKKR